MLEQAEIACREEKNENETKMFQELAKVCPEQAEIAQRKRIGERNQTRRKKRCFFGNSCEQRNKCLYLHPNPNRKTRDNGQARRKKCFFGHGCKQKSKCSYLHPRPDEETSNPKEEVDIVKTIMNEAPIIASHIEAEVIVGNIIGKVDVRSDIKSSHTVEGVDIVKTVVKVAPIVVSHVENKAAAVNTVEEAPSLLEMLMYWPNCKSKTSHQD